MMTTTSIIGITAIREHWGDEYPDCNGDEQSPIDLTGETETDLTDITFNYQSSPLEIVNNGHTIVANVEAGSSIVSDGVTYNLLQFHFHAQSEHQVDGVSYPMEMHLVHKSADEVLAVVGVFLEGGGAENGSFSTVLDNMPAEEEGTEEPADDVDPADLLPAAKTYYKYDGSLTTPPCSEGVKWHVLETPVELSDAQIAQFTDLFDHNYRPVQDLNGRTLELDNTPS
ncbi:MAG: carbonic anhydrase family protein [Deltaproteobacteria bacterium]|nr:carbonic anhydrase family protein [Deltaproteobacteria bacterium]